MKRIVSVFLSLSLVLSFMLPVAQATNTYGMVDSYTIEDSNGNALTFKLVDNGGGNFTLNYYLNNVLDTVYEMSRDSSIITATNQKTITRQSTTYTLDNSEMRQSMKSMLPDSRKPTGWSYMGNIFYGYSSSLTCSPTAILEYQDTASYADTFIVDTYANSGYADTVALVTSTLIAVILSLVCPVATIAATVVMCMISYYGGEVINGTISVLFRETYDCVTTEYDVRATMTGS